MDRKFLRPGWIVGHLLVVLAALVCLRLGRWQWHRMHEGGTIQNFGYAVLWPVFGVAFIYMWFRFLQLEKLKDAEDDAELTALAAGGPLAATGDRDGGAEPSRPAGSPMTATPVGVTPVTATPVGATPGGAEPPAVPVLDRSTRPLTSGDGARLPDDVPAQHQASDSDLDSRSTPEPAARVSRTTPSTGVTVAVATVGGDGDDDDPELAAYNRALAALAEKDHRRAR